MTAKLGEDGRCARIVCDSRREEGCKRDNSDNCSAGASQSRRRSKVWQHTVNGVKGQALLGRVTGGRRAFFPACGGGKFAAKMSHRVPLRRLLRSEQGEDQQCVA